AADQGETGRSCERDATGMTFEGEYALAGQRVEVLPGRVVGAVAHVLADLPHRGRHAPLLHEPLDEGQDLLLDRGERPSRCLYIHTWRFIQYRPQQRQDPGVRVGSESTLTPVNCRKRRGFRVRGRRRGGATARRRRPGGSGGRGPGARPSSRVPPPGPP